MEGAAAVAALRVKQVHGGVPGTSEHTRSLAARGLRSLAYNEGVQVTVLLFASIAEKAGTRRLELPLEAGDTVATVRERLLLRFPHLRPFVPTLMYALDEEYVKETAAVNDGATLALIPPVSGG